MGPYVIRNQLFKIREFKLNRIICKLKKCASVVHGCSNKVNELI